MRIGNIYNNMYAKNMYNSKNNENSSIVELIQKNKTENAYGTEKVELSEEGKLEAFKKEIWNEINSWPRNPMVSVSIRITDGAFKRMMTDEEFKNSVMNVMLEDALVARPPIAYGMTNVDENGYSGVSYNDYSMGKSAFAAHSKGKDSFYVKKISRRMEEKKKLEEKKRIEEELYKKKHKRKIMLADFLNSQYEIQMRLKQSLSNSEVNTQVNTTIISDAKYLNMGAMATAAYEQNSIFIAD